MVDLDLAAGLVQALVGLLLGLGAAVSWHVDQRRRNGRAYKRVAALEARVDTHLKEARRLERDGFGRLGKLERHVLSIDKRLLEGDRRFDELEDLQGLTLALLVEADPVRERVVAMAKSDLYADRVKPRLERLHRMRNGKR
jgi:hypothetical protein